MAPNGRTQMCIVTGPNIDIAIKLIRRLKNIFESKLHIIFQNKETVLELNIKKRFSLTVLMPDS